MKRHLLSLLLVAGVAGLSAQQAQAQDKPVLNSAPPGPPATPPRTVEPAPTPVTPTPATEPVVTPEPVPAAPPTPDAPSGLNFPNRAATKAGGAEDKPPTKKFIYANVGLGYTSSDLNQFTVSAAPALGFRITDKFAVGPGLSYAYNNFSLSPDNFIRLYGIPYPSPNGRLTPGGSNSLATSSVGLKGFAQYIVYKEFFVHAEYEVTNAQLVFQDTDYYFYKQNKTVTSALAGVGYRSYLGQNVALDILGLYNFNSSVFSLYPGFNLRFCLLVNIGK